MGALPPARGLTVEYLVRLATVDRPWRHARSFFGIVDLLAVLPTSPALFMPELHALIDVRILRLLRIFRIFRPTPGGFGDITPRTDFGCFIASVIMLIGWGTLAVPTGIVTAEMTVRRHARAPAVPRSCAACGTAGYGPEAKFCQQCGSPLRRPGPWPPSS